MSPSIAVKIAEELGARPAQIEAAVRLFDDGATVPFVARYRKEATGGLDDTQLRRLHERLQYLRELEARRASVLSTIDEQQKLTPQLRAAIEQAATKQELEDLYLPYQKKRRTKAMIAREAGLEPLALGLLADPTADPAVAARAFVAPERSVPDIAAALEGARAILVEQFAEDATLRSTLRGFIQRDALLCAKVVRGQEALADAQRFRDYFAHSEPLAAAPGHRVLAMLRARNEGCVELGLALGDDRQPLGDDPTGEGQRQVMVRFGIDARAGRAAAWLADTARLCFRGKLSVQLESEAFAALRARAEQEAILVFGANLRDLLLLAPAGPKVIMGLDPGIRTGCKVAVVDRTGKLLHTTTIYPHEPRCDRNGALRTLHACVQEFGVELVAIGNGTASRETDQLVGELLQQLGTPSHSAGNTAGNTVQKVTVSEAGASVYSASERGAQEFPDLDVSLRGAVSIARRLQDPLAELVKIDPKSIGVGQYQHDVDQSQLLRTLDAVVEDCVNHVGAELNTASVDLLARIAGLGPALARNIVTHRNEHGAFRTRRQLLDVPRLGQKAFEQCAGFLRIQGGDNPLDQSAVHPEAYPVVHRLLQATARELRAVLGDRAFLRGLDPAGLVDERFGLPTVSDILAELEKPGRDPRPLWRTATFAAGVQTLADLQPGMQLEGVVTNVANFGAFVDIGVHQDGLVHISQLADRFVADPREVVTTGQIVKVKVLEVDAARQRIALTMRLHERPTAGRSANPAARPPAPPKRAEPEVQSPLAAQLAKLKLRQN